MLGLYLFIQIFPTERIVPFLVRINYLPLWGLNLDSLIHRPLRYQLRHPNLLKTSSLSHDPPHLQISGPMWIVWFTTSLLAHCGWNNKALWRSWITQPSIDVFCHSNQVKNQYCGEMNVTDGSASCRGSGCFALSYFPCSHLNLYLIKVNSDKVFLLLSDLYRNPERGFKPGT